MGLRAFGFRCLFWRGLKSSHFWTCAMPNPRRDESFGYEMYSKMRLWALQIIDILWIEEIQPTSWGWSFIPLFNDGSSHIFSIRKVILQDLTISIEEARVLSESREKRGRLTYRNQLGVMKRSPSPLFYRHSFVWKKFSCPLSYQGCPLNKTENPCTNINIKKHQGTKYPKSSFLLSLLGVLRKTKKNKLIIPSPPAGSRMKVVQSVKNTWNLGWEF